MAEDIMNLLMQSYTNNARAQTQNMNSAGQNINNMSTFTSNHNMRNIPSSAKPFFEKELKEIEKINNQELKRYESLYKKELELHEYSLKFKKDLYEQESKHYKNIFNLQTGIHEQLVNYKENERNIYKEISKNGKITLQNQFELYSLKVKEQELEKQTAEYKIKKFE